MQPTLRTGGALLTLLTLISAPLAPAHAASWPSAGMDFQAWARSYSSRGSGISSALQKKINKLDDDEVEDLPIPILLGVSQASLTKNFGDPRDGGARKHEGLDIMAPKDAYIVSPTEAVVLRTGKGETEGNYVQTANPGGETFVYMHLDKFAEDLESGDELKPGDLIGYVGNTGNAAGGPTHLHFEIRKNRTPYDPYPRLTKEFTTEERIDAIESILEDSDDEDEEAEMLVKNNRGLFILAQTQKIQLPKAITEAMGDAGVTATTSVNRDLTLGSSGNDVIALQVALITKDSGAAAGALAKAGATGYFGTITQNALIEYQLAAKISPAAGYFGPLTRAKLGL